MNQVIKFVKEAKNELKRVQWPSKKETVRLTVYVIAGSFGVGLFVMLVDYLFKELLGIVIAA